MKIIDYDGITDDICHREINYYYYFYQQCFHTKKIYILCKL